MKTAYQSILVCFISLILFSTFSCQMKAQVGNTETSKSITQILKENSQKSISTRISLYQDYKKKYPKKILEEEMNLYGYSLLWDGNAKESIEIFKLLVNDYPESSNTYDSLAEAYLADDNPPKALFYYEKAFAMDPDNFNAEDQIEKIKNPDTKILKSKDKFDVKYAIQEYKEDLDQLGQTLIDVHPNALKFITQEKLVALIEAKKNVITEHTTYAEFAWHCSEIVASINCSHTGTGRFYPEFEMMPFQLQFPLSTRLINSQLYVVDPLNNAQWIAPKDEILSINGEAIEDIIKDTYRHIPSQGYIESSKRHEFNKWSSSMIPFSLGFPSEYTIQIKGKKEPIKLQSALTQFKRVKDQSKAYCGDDLCIEFLDTDKKIAILTISSFNYYVWSNFKEFERFIDECMEDFQTYGTEQLIIDVRDNGGGSSESSIHLLKYLIEEPFIYYSKAEYESKTELVLGEKLQHPFKNRYQGKLMFLIDGVGNSTTGHFMSIVKERNLGVIIGEELGSNHFCSAGQKPCRLRNTKLNFYVANNTHISTANNSPDEVGVLPDHFVYQSIEEYLAGKDAIKQFAKDLIAKETQWTPTSKYHSSHFLESDPTWDKELFRIPLNFAPEITLNGIEDARFPDGWNKSESPNFWSYVFAWNVDHPQMLTIEEMSYKLELYFNGLMNIEKRGEEAGVSSSDGFLEITKSKNGISTYKGTIKTLDGFFTKKPLTFNIQAEQRYCKDAKRAIVIFRFSPQEFTSDVWNTLKTVTFPDTICEK